MTHDERSTITNRRRTTAPVVAPVVIGAMWIAAVALFATQWYAYDASRADAEPFELYLWWSAYMWGLLTPAAAWLAWRFPIGLATWKTRVPLHAAASLALTALQLSLEALLGWIRNENTLSAAGALRHYFGQHTQISLATYGILIAAVMIYRTHRTAQESRLRSVQLEAQLTSARLELLRSQLNPHFLFNTLQAATTLVHEDPNRAEEMLVRLGDLLRAALRESQVQEIPLREELEVLAHYTAIQSCRFPDRLRFVIDVAPDARGCLVPALMLQPLVENAVRYGVGTHRMSDVVTVCAVRAGARLRIEISNNTGHLSGDGAPATGHGFGLAATRERLAQLYGADGGSLELRNLQPAGVAAAISIPARVGDARVAAHVTAVEREADAEGEGTECRSAS